MGMKNITKFQDREKYKLIDKLLIGDHVLLHVFPQLPGVSLPNDLMNHNSVTLKISRLFRGGLEMLNDRIESNLLFGNSYFLCILPYDSIWGLTSDSGKTYTWSRVDDNTFDEQLEEDDSDCDNDKDDLKSTIINNSLENPEDLSATKDFKPSDGDNLNDISNEVKSLDKDNHKRPTLVRIK
jgi:stringent starvation protein B